MTNIQILSYNIRKYFISDFKKISFVIITNFKNLSMSVIFNHTFTADKPIIYPSNWQSGKTAAQQFQQFRNSLPYFIVSNIIQIIIASAWMFLIYALILAIREILKLNKMEDGATPKVHNRKYLQKNFILRISFIGTVVMGITLGLLIFSEVARYSLLKGLVGFSIGFICHKYYNNHNKKTKNRSGYLKISQKQE